MMEELEKRLKEALEQCKVRGKNTPAFKAVFSQGFRAAWNINPLWKDAQGDDLPPIDKEVIVLLDNGKVCYGHRPKEYWDGKNIATGEVTRHYPKRYDKGGWNIPDVKWWLDADLPKMEK